MPAGNKERQERRRERAQKGKPASEQTDEYDQGSLPVYRPCALANRRAAD